MIRGDDRGAVDARPGERAQPAPDCRREASLQHAQAGTCSRRRRTARCPSCRLPAAMGNGTRNARREGGRVTETTLTHRMEVRLDDDGTLDRWLRPAPPCTWSAWSAGHWWLGIESAGRLIHVNLSTKGGAAIVANVDDQTAEAAPWEIEECEWAFHGYPQRNALLAAGWEPFAVSNGSIWFRRRRP